MFVELLFEGDKSVTQTSIPNCNPVRWPAVPLLDSGNAAILFMVLRPSHRSADHNFSCCLLSIQS